jgi:hypothetical protein
MCAAYIACERCAMYNLLLSVLCVLADKIFCRVAGNKLLAFCFCVNMLSTSIWLVVVAMRLNHRLGV